jgi:hypothetical protein
MSDQTLFDEIKSFISHDFISKCDWVSWNKRSCSFYEKQADEYWKTKLSHYMADSDLKPIELNIHSHCDSKMMMNQWNLSTRSVGLITSFMEQGTFSGLCYQPNVNHRFMRTENWRYSHSQNSEYRPPMCRTILSSNPEHGLTEITPLSLYAYEVKMDETFDDASHMDTCDRLMTRYACYVNVETGDNTSIEDRHGFGYLKHRVAGDLSRETFDRLLQIFGFFLDDSSTVGLDAASKISPSVICQFFNVFNNEILHNPGGFKAFLEKFGLTRLYSYDEDVSVSVNHRRFGELLRAICSFRISVYDGQHRFLLYTHYYSGYFDVEHANICPLESKSFKDCNSADDMEAFSRLQLWKNNRITFGCPVKTLEDGSRVRESNFKEGLKAMLAYGKAITNAQSLNIALSFAEVMATFSREMLSDNIRDRTIKRLTFDNFWASHVKTSDLDTAFGRNSTVILDYISGKVKSDVKIKMIVISNKLKWDDVEEKFRDLYFKANYLLPQPYVSGRTGAPAGVAVLLEMFRMGAVDPDMFREFIKFASMQRQGKLDMEAEEIHDTRFKSLDWLRVHIFDIGFYLNRLLNCHLTKERCLLAAAYEMKDATARKVIDCLAESEEKWKSEWKIELPATMKSNRYANYALETDLENVVLKDSGLGKASGVTIKLLQATVFVLLREMFLALNNIGFTPQLHWMEHEGKNVWLKKYMTNRFFPLYQGRHKKKDHPTDNQIKLIMEVLCVLYEEYVFNLLNVKDVGLVILLKPFLNADNVLTGKKVKQGYRDVIFRSSTNTGGFHSRHEEFLANIDALVPEKMKFGTFVKGVSDGSINTDTLEGFVQQVKKWEDSGLGMEKKRKAKLTKEELAAKKKQKMEDAKKEKKTEDSAKKSLAKASKRKGKPSDPDYVPDSKTAGKSKKNSSSGDHVIIDGGGGKDSTDIRSKEGNDTDKDQVDRENAGNDKRSGRTADSDEDVVQWRVLQSSLSPSVKAAMMVKFMEMGALESVGISLDQYREAVEREGVPEELQPLFDDEDSAEIAEELQLEEISTRRPQNAKKLNIPLRQGINEPIVEKESNEVIGEMKLPLQQGSYPSRIHLRLSKEKRAQAGIIDYAEKSDDDDDDDEVDEDSDDEGDAEEVDTRSGTAVLDEESAEDGNEGELMRAAAARANALTHRADNTSTGDVEKSGSGDNLDSETDKGDEAKKNSGKIGDIGDGEKGENKSGAGDGEADDLEKAKMGGGSGVVGGTILDQYRVTGNPGVEDPYNAAGGLQQKKW